MESNNTPTTQATPTELQPRYKSWTLWLALAALVAYIVKALWQVDISETLNTVMELLLPILVAFGIVNNPTSKTTL